MENQKLHEAINSGEPIPFNAENFPDFVKPQLTEARLQQNCFLWFWEKYPHLRRLLFHVPNGGLRDKVQAARLKAIGVIAGVPDMIFLLRSRAYFFEFKEPGGRGQLSKAQKEFHALLELQGFEVWLIDSEAYFRDVVADLVSRGESCELQRCMTMAEVFYERRVWEHLYSLPVGVVQTLAHLCEDSTRPQFVKCVERFIEAGHGFAEGVEVLFTPDYQAIYKNNIQNPIDIHYGN